MGQWRDLCGALGRRTLLALPFLVTGIVLAVRAGDRLHGLALVVPFGLAVGIILAPALGELAAEPLRSLFYPVDRLAKPGPMFGPLETLTARGAYEEARAGYEKLLVEHPDELRAWVGLVDLAWFHFQDADWAGSYVERGKAVLKREGDRLALESHLRDITATAARPVRKEHEKRVVAFAKVNRQAPVEEPDGLQKKRYHAGGHQGKIGHFASQ